MPNTTITHAQQAIRTRFAPSPTGFLHLGGARTALYSWAFARHYGGQFILRIEDTDVERSTPAAVQAILDGMQWLGLDYDEGPYYQMQRMALYTPHIQALLASGHAYPCYCTVAELEQMREQQRQNSQKIAYDGTWRPEPGKTLPAIPAGVKPVIRFKNPRTGTVAWDDLVKGPIAIDNAELDDLIIARQDGTPTYNFCVVVDDLDMRITHVIRGDDHINNTPRQINILRALGGEVPKYGHLPMILGDDGEKLSKRHGAVSVMEYYEQGFLPESMVNYLARLGWSHGDEELFTRTQLVDWFDGSHWSKSAAQFNPEKLQWVNAHHMRQAQPQALLADLAQRLGQIGINPQSPSAPPLAEVLTVVLERANTLVQLRDEAALFYRQPQPQPEAITPLLEPAVLAALASFVEGLKSPTLAQAGWTTENLSTHLKSTLAAHGLKMPKLAMPLRLMLTGQTQTPSIDKVMTLLGQSTVLARLEPWINPTPKGQA